MASLLTKVEITSVTTHKTMAWRPYENLMEGELDNTVLGKVTGWIRFFRKGMEPLEVTLDLKGDFHEDIKGKRLRLYNPEPEERNDKLDREGTYMEGIAEEQKGEVGDITAGLKVNGKYPYVDYPYIEWFSDANWRIVLELFPGQVQILG